MHRFFFWLCLSLAFLELTYAGFSVMADKKYAALGALLALPAWLLFAASYHVRSLHQ